MKNLKLVPNNYIKAVLFICFLAFGAADLYGQTEHTVRSGETLFSISRTYDVTVENIREWNNLSGNIISVGQVLIVSGPEESRESSGSQATQDDAMHTVKPGETLFRISRLYDVSVSDIREWNNLRNDNIEIGLQLKISDRAISAGSPDVEERTVTRDAAPATRPSEEYHEVAPGETLFRISQQYNMSVTELQRMNNLSGTQLDIGQRLIVKASPPLPSGAGDIAETEAATAEEETAVAASSPLGAFSFHVLRENETVEGLISRHRMDLQEFSSLNPRFESDEIKPGDTVKVLKPVATGRKNPYRVSSNLQTGGDISVTVYDPQQKGSTTTSGDLYNPAHLTAAHSSLRLGKVIYIENPANGKGIFVQVNDRVTGNFLKLSAAAFNALGFEGNDELAAIIYEEIPD